MDSSEQELIFQLQKQNPDSQCFTENKDNSATIDQRLAELELEKLLKQIQDVYTQRKSQYTRSESFPTLSSLNDVKSVLYYRAERKAKILKLTLVPTPKLPQTLGDLISKEVDLCTVPRNTFSYTSTILKDFFRQRKDFLVHKRYKLLYRWARYCTDSEIVERVQPILELRLHENENEYDDCVSKCDRIDATNESGEPQPPSLRPHDFQVYLRDQAFQATVLKKIHKFFKRLQWMHVFKTHELITRCNELMTSVRASDGTGSKSSSSAASQIRESDPDQSVPQMVLDVPSLDARLYELRNAFDISADINSDDGQEFFYYVNKKFSAIFQAQQQAHSFILYDVPQAGSASGGSGAGGSASRPQSEMSHSAASLFDSAKNSVRARTAASNGSSSANLSKTHALSEDEKMHAVRLKDCPWLPYVDVFGGGSKVGSAQEAQHIRLSTLRKVDHHLRLECSFLECADVSHAVRRLKDLAESHGPRAETCVPISPHEGEDEEESRDGGAEGERKLFAFKSNPQLQIGSMPKFKLFSLYFLRFARTREFRRKLLSLLNYFRSIEQRLVMDAHGFAFEKALQSPANGSPEPATTSLFKSASRIGFADTTTPTPAAASSETSGAPTKPKHLTPPDLAKILPEHVIKMSAIELRDDTYATGPKGELVVMDSNGVPVLYDAALRDLDELADELIRIGSHYIFSQDGTGRIDGPIDRLGVLEDLFESETCFQEAKRSLVCRYMEAYENALSPDDQRAIAQQIMNIIALRPSLDLSAPYFTDSYVSSVTSLELQQTLVRDLTSSLVNDETSYVSSVYARSRPARGPGATSGHPDNLIRDARLTMPLFPGGLSVPILDFFSSLGSIRSLPGLLAQCRQDLVTRFKITNPLMANCLERAILEQAALDWKAVVTEDAKTPRQQTSPIRPCSFLDDADELDTLIKELASAMASTKKDMDPTESQTRAAPGRLKLVPSGSEQDDSTGRAKDVTEGGFALGSGTYGHLLQGCANACEAVFLRKNLVDALCETEILNATYRRQARLMGREVFKAQLEPVKFDEAAANEEIAAVEHHVDPGTMLPPIIDPLVLAIHEFERSVASFDLESNAGAKALVDFSGLSELRSALQAQIAERNSLAVAVRYNQVPVDVYESTWMLRPEENAFITSKSFDGSPTHARRKVFADREAKDTATRVEIRRKLPGLFLSYNKIKIGHRFTCIGEYTERSVNVFKSKRPEVIRRKLRDLKLDLLYEYCTNMSKEIRDVALKLEILNTLESLKSALKDVPDDTPMLLPFVLGEEGDQILDDLRCKIDQEMAAKFEKQMAQPGRPAPLGPPRSTCFLARSGEVIDPFYLPHYTQIMDMQLTTRFKTTPPDPSEHRSSRSAAAAAAEKPEKGPDVSLLHMLQCFQSYLDILLFLRARSKMNVTQSEACLDAHGLDQVPHDLRRLKTEMEHVKKSSSSAAIRKFLMRKRTWLFLKYSLVLRNLIHLFKGRSNATAVSTITGQLNLLQGNSQPAATSGIFNQSESAFKTWWPLSALLCKAEPQLSTTDAAICSLDDSPSLSSFPNTHFSFLHSNFLLRLPESDRHYFSGEEMAVELLLEDLLSESGIYSSAMAEDAVSAETEFLTDSLVLVNLKEHFIANVLQPSVPHESDHTQEKMAEFYESTILSKAKAILAKAEAHERAPAVAPVHSKELSIRRAQVTVLKREIDRSLIQATHRDLAAVHKSVISEFQAAQEQRSSEGDGQSGGSFLMSLKKGESKYKMASDFLENLMSRAMVMHNESGENILTVPERHIQNALDALFGRLEKWHQSELAMRDHLNSQTTAHLRHVIFRHEQKIKFLEAQREFDKKALNLRVQADVSDKNFQIMFQMENITRQNKRLEARLEKSTEIIRERIKAEFEDRVRDLQTQLILTQEKLRDYKAQLHGDIQSSLVEIKKETMLEFAQKEGLPLELKRKALKITRHDDELAKLKEENAKLNSAIEKLKTTHTLELIQIKAKQEKQVLDLKKDQQDSAREYWHSKETVEERETALRQQLISVQNALSASEIEVEQLRKEMSQQAKNKQPAIYSKVKSTLQQQVADVPPAEKAKKQQQQMERSAAANYDVDKLLLEIQKKDEQIKLHSDAEAKAAKSAEMLQAQKDKELGRMQLKLAQESKLKLSAFEKLEDLRRVMSEDPAFSWRDKLISVEQDLRNKQSELEFLKRFLSDQGLEPPQFAPLPEQDSPSSSVRSSSLTRPMRPRSASAAVGRTFDGLSSRPDEVIERLRPSSGVRRDFLPPTAKRSNGAPSSQGHSPQRSKAPTAGGFTSALSSRDAGSTPSSLAGLTDGGGILLGRRPSSASSVPRSSSLKRVTLK